MAGMIHETAIVEDGAKIGEGTRIWHHAHVRSGSEIGSGCNIGKNCYIDAGAKIGNGVKIQNNVSVYHGVEIGDEVFVGPSAVFTNDFYPRASAGTRSGNTRRSARGAWSRRMCRRTRWSPGIRRGRSAGSAGADIGWMKV